LLVLLGSTLVLLTQQTAAHIPGITRPGAPGNTGLAWLYLYYLGWQQQQVLLQELGACWQ